MPTFRYYITGVLTDEQVNNLLDLLTNAALLTFHPDVYPVTIEQFERTHNQTSFTIIFTAKAGETYPTYYEGQLNAAESAILGLMHKFEAISP